MNFDYKIMVDDKAKKSVYIWESWVNSYDNVFLWILSLSLLHILLVIMDFIGVSINFNYIADYLKI